MDNLIRDLAIIAIQHLDLGKLFFPPPDQNAYIEKMGYIIQKGQEQIATEQPQTPTEATHSTSQVSTVTPEETFRYQNIELGKELYKLELHLSQRCRIFGKPCDCCEKHTLLIGLAEETVPIATRIGQPADVYLEIVSWLNQHGHKFNPEAVESGQYDAEYPILSGQASLFRKRITGTEKISALLTQEENQAIQNKAKDMLEEQMDGASDEAKEQARAILEDKLAEL